MADWKKYYEEHLTSMEKAAKTVKSGDTMYLGSTLVISGAFMDALADRSEELRNVTILANMYLTPAKILMDPEYKKSFHTITFFANIFERMAAMQNNIDFNPVPYADLVYAVTDIYKTDTVCVEVCPADENGMFNVGALGTNFTPNIMRDPRIKKRIAIVNKFQPLANGEPDLVQYKVEDFDYIIENDHDIPELPISEPTQFDKRIAEYIIPYINDGDVIQVGMGGLGNQIAKDLISKKDLKMFTEIATDSMIELAEAGVVKEIQMGGSIGSKQLYNWIGSHPEICTLLEVSKLLAPEKVSAVDNLVSINATFQIDITGQACSEAQGCKEYGGVGGSFAYLYSTPRANNGRSFLCLRSTYKDSAGQVHSNVHALLPEGSIVTTPRYLVQYLVTEHGIADVYLKSLKDRIKAIIPIAHPDYREQLKKQAVECGYMGEEDFDL